LKKEEEYIQEFARIFQAKFKYLIEKAVKNKKDFMHQNDLIQEVIQHANHCRKLTSKMPEFHKTYSSLAEYLNNDQNTCPFVLTGPSGAGKSSIMAFVAKKVIYKIFKILFMIILFKTSGN
jgi:DNA replication protein DnaC